MAFANPRLPYILHTDASMLGLGAALYQEQDGKAKTVAKCLWEQFICHYGYPEQPRLPIDLAFGLPLKDEGGITSCILKKAFVLRMKVPKTWQKEIKPGPIRTLHRDLLLPCGALPSETIECESQSSVPKRKTRSETAYRRSDGTDEIPDSEEEDEYCLMPQFDLVDASFVVRTPEVPQPI
ncbi:hypothetical protein QTP70_016709 [Hemibagrus guttatus]|uniref:Reverse transcriptase/retrotransposon-derived protein RNase H-like domain-containing protein n=1 Tax=Hemibagrus guttatus TaxID=175788 RepID=A0AAE0QA54_9TELE|nr:hypothetical protein QTP70_016709 [Hemibagrus guttatus]